MKEKTWLKIDRWTYVGIQVAQWLVILALIFVVCWAIWLWGAGVSF